ncbi:MAG: FHA domain-containing protein [Planctomycetota bacterium]|jgi:pSer/pThr/pTyr-binding forkhead associated (FHA) protein
MTTDVLVPRVRVVRDHKVLREIQLDGTLSIGRLPDNDLVLEDDLVSGHHGRIEQVSGGWQYVDLGSTNGSVVAAGPTLRDKDRFDLSDGVQILLGATVLDVRMDVGSTIMMRDERRSESPRPPRGSAEAERGPPPGRPRVLIATKDRCVTVELSSSPATLGRLARCDVTVEDASVSGRHAELGYERGEWQLRDLASTNGTRLGIHRVVHARRITSGAHIILGSVDLLFVVDDGTGPDPLVTLDMLQRDKRLGAAQVREAREALEKGDEQLCEILVRRGWLSPGEWSEAASESSVATRPAGRNRWLPVAGALIVIAVAAWLIARALASGSG